MTYTCMTFINFWRIGSVLGRGTIWEEFPQFDTFPHFSTCSTLDLKKSRF